MSVYEKILLKGELVYEEKFINRFLKDEIEEIYLIFGRGCDSSGKVEIREIGYIDKKMGEWSANLKSCDRYNDKVLIQIAKKLQELNK